LTWERPWDCYGTLQYMPPESFDETFAPLDLNDDNALKAVDWWSAGCVLYELLCGEMAFHDKEDEVLKEKIRKGVDGMAPIPATMKPEAAALITAFVRTMPERRLGYGGVDEVKKAPWLSDMPWDQIANRTYVAPYIPFRHSYVNQPHRRTMINPRMVPGLRVKNPSKAQEFIGDSLRNPVPGI